MFVALHVVLSQLDAARLHDVQARYGVIGAPLRDAMRGSLEVSGHGLGIVRDVVVPLLGHQLLHAGAFAVVLSTVTLWVFGGRIEARLGSARFLLFHLLAGACAGVAQGWLVAPGGAIVVGASGAVAASIAACLVLAPRSRIVLLVPVVVVPVIVEVGALALAAGWLLLQLRPIQALLALGETTPIGYVGVSAGACAGVALLPVMLVGRRRVVRPGRA